MDPLFMNTVESVSEHGLVTVCRPTNGTPLNVAVSFFGSDYEM